MLHKYILNKDKVAKYFPEVGDAPSGAGDLVENEGLVCIQSNRWIDIEEADRYIPFCFKTEQPLDDYQEELMVRYIESYTDTEGVFLILIRNLGTDSCEYRCLLAPINEISSSKEDEVFPSGGNVLSYSGGNVLYVTEKDSYEMKQKLSILEKDTCFLTTDPNCGKCYQESIEIDGVWMVPKECDLSQDKYTVHNHQIASKMLDIPCHDGVFVGLRDGQKSILKQIGDKCLPSIRVQRSKLIGLIDKLIESGDPLYTPVKIKECLKNGTIHFHDSKTFFKMLSEVENDEVGSAITDEPTEFIMALRENGIPFVASGNKHNKLFEVVYLKGEHSLEKIGFNIDDVVMEGCKNYHHVKRFPDLCKLDTLIIDGHGVVAHEGDMVYRNPGTGKILPFDIVHSFNTYKNGLDIKKSGYDPHKDVNITIPLEVDIDVIDDCHVSISVKTNKEEVFLCEKLPLRSRRPGHIELVRHLIKKLWKKGYLLNDYGLACAHHYGKYETGCIQKPWWFLPKPDVDRDISPDTRTDDMVSFISAQL